MLCSAAPLPRLPCHAESSEPRCVADPVLPLIRRRQPPNPPNPPPLWLSRSRASALGPPPSPAPRLAYTDRKKL